MFPSSHGLLTRPQVLDSLRAPLETYLVAEESSPLVRVTTAVLRSRRLIVRLSLLGALIGIGEGVKQVQTIFRPVFGLEDMLPDGGDFDRLFRDGERFRIGGLDVEVMHLPGHTPACIAYRILPPQ